MLTEQESQSFILFLERYTEFYRDFVALEQSKTKSISEDDVESIDSFVTKEQAYLLKSRGLEVERDKIMDSYGLKDLVLKDFLTHLDESVQNTALTLYADLSDLLFALKRTNSTNNTMMELRLHRIEKELERLEREGQPLPQKYDNNAKSGNKPFNMISRKI